MNRRPLSADDLDTVAAAFDSIKAMPGLPFPRQPEPEAVTPADLRTAGGVFVTDSALSLRDCRNCRRAIHVGQPRVNHRPTATSAVTHHYHPTCVVVPKGEPSA